MAEEPSAKRAACLECRRARLRCDRASPCGRCVRKGCECTPLYRGPGRPRKTTLAKKDTSRNVGLSALPAATTTRTRGAQGGAAIPDRGGPKATASGARPAKAAKPVLRSSCGGTKRKRQREQGATTCSGGRGGGVSSSHTTRRAQPVHVEGYSPATYSGEQGQPKRPTGGGGGASASLDLLLRAAGIQDDARHEARGKEQDRRGNSG